MLRHYLSPTEGDWDMYLSLIEFAYINTWKESIGTTSFMLDCSHHPLKPLNRGMSRCHVSTPNGFIQLMFSILQEAKKHLVAAQNK